MTAGMSAVNLANAILNAFDGSAPTLTATHVLPHTGDPGSAGTANTIGTGEGSTRRELAWGTAANGVRAITNTPQWEDWDSGSVTVNHISMWSALTSGTFRFSSELGTPQDVDDGDTLRLTNLQFAFTPIAAD